MQEEIVFSPNEITLSNISEISESASMLFERQICELAELADEAARLSAELADEGMSVYEITALIAEKTALMEFSPHASAMPEELLRLAHYTSALSCIELSAFSALYIEKLRDRGLAACEGDFLSHEELAQTFVYHKNAYSDEAYDVFSQDFNDPRVRYADSLRDALRLVADGVISYAIVPLEERGSRLPTVAELLYKHDLKINSVIPVFGFDGTADMRYALVSRSYSVPAITSEDDRYLEIRLSADSERGLSYLMLAAESQGARLYRVNSAFYEVEGERRGFYSAVFVTEGGDFTGLLTFLSLSSLDYSAVGIYSNLE